MQAYVDYGFIRTKNMIEDGERRARWYANVGSVPPASEGRLRKALHALSARWANAQQHVRRSLTAPAHSEQPTG
jgi:hypothetical protein